MKKNEIDSSDLLARVNFHVPARILRNFRLLRVDQTTRAYSDNEPLYATPRVCSLPAAAADGRSLSLKFSATRASHKFIAGSNIIPTGCVQSLVFFVINLLLHASLSLTARYTSFMWFLHAFLFVYLFGFCCLAI